MTPCDWFLDDCDSRPQDEIITKEKITTCLSGIPADLHEIKSTRLWLGFCLFVKLAHLTDLENVRLVTEEIAKRTKWLLLFLTEFPGVLISPYFLADEMRLLCSGVNVFLRSEAGVLFTNKYRQILEITNCVLFKHFEDRDVQIDYPGRNNMDSKLYIICDNSK